METEWAVETPLLVDRSTLDAFVNHPYRARMAALGLGKEASLPLEVGCAVHDCFANLTARHIQEGGILATELASRLESELAGHTPRITPDVIAATRASIWPWARFMGGVRPDGIMRHDGGKGELSGQLAMEIDGVTVTSEVDLMLATASPEYVKVIDYKTGWGLWDEDDVEASFQFQLHALLIFSTYREVEQVGIAVWNTRVNRLTKFVRLSRENLSVYFGRVESAVIDWLEMREAEPETLPCYPSETYCPTCPVLMQCRYAREEQKATPGELVKRLFVLQQQQEAVEKVLKAHVEHSGGDVEADGLCFGSNKPKASRKPTMTLYKKGKESDD
jgi:hypothetical protein